jgi:predicted nucleic acid-binding protein
VIYLDSCLVIYLVEQHPRWGEPAGRLLGQVNGPDFVISSLVKCECLVGPIKRGDQLLQQSYTELFGELVSLGLPEAVYLNAAEMRGRFGVKIPDALHLACAQHHRCDELWTNDDRLTRVSHGLARNVLAGSSGG